MRGQAREQTRTYNRNELLALRRRAATPQTGLPMEIRAHKRGTRSGARVKEKRNKRNNKTYLPSAVMGNIRSLASKTDELSALTKHQAAYKESSILCFTESWLHENIQDSAVELGGFTMVRADGSKNSGKRKGGGLVVFINSRWCHSGHATVKQQICTPNIELLVSLRVYYLPREFSHVLAVTVYIPPSAVPSHDVIHSSIAELQTVHPSAFILVNRDFNNVNVPRTLTDFKQYVTCSTRQSKTLDMLFANVKDAYRSTAPSPLGGSDHNLVRLVPTYMLAIKRLPTATSTVPQRSVEVEEELRECFRTTDWEMLKGVYGEDIDGLAVYITDYIRLCEEVIVPTKKEEGFQNRIHWGSQGGEKGT